MKTLKTYILHHAHSLLSLGNKLVLGLLNLLTGIFAQVVQVTVGGGLFTGFDRIQRETSILDTLAGLGCEHQVGVQRRVPSSQEARLDLRILRQTRLADSLLGKSIFLQSSRKRIFAMAALRQGLRAGERSARDRVIEGFW